MGVTSYWRARLICKAAGGRPWAMVGPIRPPIRCLLTAHIGAITRILAGRYLVQNTNVHIPPWHEFLVFSIGVNLLCPVIRDERGPVRYLAGMNWVINRPWVPLLCPWYQVAKAQKQCSGHLELAICPKSMFPDHKHPKPLCCPAGLGAQAKLFPR